MVKRAAVLRMVLTVAGSYFIVVIVYWATAFQTGKNDTVSSVASTRTLVVIVGYMRSGSSLTGNLLQHNQDVFYVFEPLHDLVAQYINNMENTFPNLRFKSERPLMTIKSEVQQLFQAWFTCDLEFVLEEKYRYHISFFKLGHKTNILLDCLQKTTNTAYQYTKQCTEYLRKQCLSSKYIVIKTIRTPLHWLFELMEGMPNMKVVHLVRDPRAIIVSQHQYGECARLNGGMPGCSKFLCSTMEDDLTTFDMFQRLYSGRVNRLNYEELATDPIATTKSLYKYLDIDFTDSTEKYVVNITMSGFNSSHVLDTVRSNSRDIVEKWRTVITEKDLETVQTMCRHVMQRLSYHHFIRPL